MIWAFKRTATFANPKFFELQKLRLSTWKTPKYIFCGEIVGDELFLPRGTLDSCLYICNKVGAKVIIRDERLNPKRLKINFNGKLYNEQQSAVNEILKYENGVLSSPPGLGKTVMACAIISKRKTPTLILVHRSPLMDQWRGQLSELLSVEKKQIGTYGGSKKKLTGEIDIAMLQSLSNIENPDEFFQRYGQIIIDECHHIPAFSFEKALKKSPAKFILELTATPYRKDGHQAILFMQCGPIRYEMKNFNQVQFKKLVIVRETEFKMPQSELRPDPIHEVWSKLTNDEARLKLIAEDVKKVLDDGRFPLIISERKDHLAALSKAIKNTTGSDTLEFVFIGDMGKKARTKALEEINNNIGTGKKPYILATGSLIGEGFDLPPLDTLMIAMPVAFKGKLVQYAGRLHREYKGKNDVRIYDYFDGSMGLTVSMLKKRITAYKKMGYKIETLAGSKSGRMAYKNDLFG
ncbi:MAG: DEAD/DEAH box helicase family protein [bacterium]